MLIDLESTSPEPRYDSDVCILGAGVAGLILSTRLAALGFKVALLEAGGRTLEPRSQAIYEAEMAGSAHTGATEGRFRIFGGSSTRWGGQLLPYTDDIFGPAPGIPSTPWPLGPPAIEHYYPEVLRIMGLGPRAAALPFDGRDLLVGLGHPAVDLGDSIRLRYSKWAPFSRRNLVKTLGRSCLQSPNIRVFLHANVMAVETSAGVASAVRVRNYAGREFRFTARHICVCLGTIESSRLLLASGLSTPPASTQDQLGRYFHDHVGIRVAAVEGAAREQILKHLGPFFVQGSLHTAKLEASSALRQSEGMPAVMAHFVIEEPEDSGVGAVRGMLRALQRGDVQAAARNTGPMIRGLGDVARLVYASRVQGRRALSSRARVHLHVDMEQIATPDDRIRLSDATDALGQPRAVVHWRVGDPERSLAQRYASVVREQLQGSGFPPLQWLPGALSGDPAALTATDTFHPMGGLRMGTDPAASVVTPELNVHGIPNLHVASCAVFPSGGSSNPTFTLMALTLRLADHLATAKL
jgi:choline dehydrogenase-like flavoprotein